jgi:penicillin-binding protein 1C
MIVFKRRIKIFLIAAGVMIAPVLLSPFPGFRVPFSTVTEARDGSLLGARIADDGQWRFPAAEEVPGKFEKAILTFEDRWFYYHPGINPVAIARAVSGNIRAGEIVSGGSTITMQVARISRGNRKRTYGEKIVEMMSAVKLEIFRSKKTILLMYAANAPFGGNTVGLEAASWRYTGKAPSDLTWAEAATLAILPNAPSLVFPGRNQEILKAKRDRLLRRLNERGYFDSTTLELALDEPLLVEPKQLPAKAPHLTDWFYKHNRGERIRTTIDPELQERVTERVNSHQKELAGNYIFNSAAIIVEVSTGKVLAYAGNSTIDESAAHGGDVDIIRAARSTGSILKPLLYAAMQNSGEILPNTLIADIPTRFPGFSPKNFDRSYSGAVTASSALSQSLNIPAVKMLQKYSPEKFLDILRKTGFTTFGNSADYYGLSLILGGGETSLWELTGVYSSLSRVLNNYLKEGKYYKEDYHAPIITEQSEENIIRTAESDPPLSASSVWLTYEALQKVNRPENQSGWQYLSSSPDLAWKTGTSFGFRDAWAIGTTPNYVAGVWAGNADGEGRPGLTGTTAAAPLLFDLVALMKQGEWFAEPMEDLRRIKVCSESGYRAGPDCAETEEIAVSEKGLRSESCPFHQVVHLDKTGRYQVTTDCAAAEEIRNEPWFVLPPAMEYFYRQKHPEYKTLPPVAEGCRGGKNIPVMEFIYPSPGIKIFIPRDQTGTKTRVIPEIAHRNPSKRVYWHLDEIFIGTTSNIHQIEILAESGSHVLTAVDEDGNMIKCGFEIK